MDVHKVLKLSLKWLLHFRENHLFLFPLCRNIRVPYFCVCPFVQQIPVIVNVSEAICTLSPLLLLLSL